MVGGEGGGEGRDLERDRELEEVDNDNNADAMDDLLRDRFRLTAISIAEAEAKKNGLDVAGPVASCMADLAFKYAENLAKDLELFAHHAGRKTVNMDDVILCAHKNDNLAASLRFLSNDLRAKEPQFERKRKKGSMKREEKATSNVVHINDP